MRRKIKRLVVTGTKTYYRLVRKKSILLGLLACIFLAALLLPAFGLIDSYIQLILMYIGINIILTVSLNLVNGYMGEFSIGHAGFMAVGAYIGALLTMRVWPPNLVGWLFPVTVIL